MHKELAEKVNISSYFTDRNLRIGFNIKIGSHHINQDNSKTLIKPNFPAFDIKFRYINKVFEQMSINFARLMNQGKVNCQTVLSANFDKQDEDGQLLDEYELYINLKNKHNPTATDIDNFDFKSSLEYQTQQQQMKESGLRFDINNSMKKKTF